jgi:hypothetical protein
MCMICLFDELPVLWGEYDLEEMEGGGITDNTGRGLVMNKHG